MRPEPLRRAVLALASLALGWLALAAGAPGPVPAPRDESPRPRVVIGSKNFPESRLLGEMTALLLESAGYETVHESGLAGTLICFTALRSGEIDLYPEYTGSAWSVVLEEPEKASNSLRVFLHVRDRYRELYDIEWIEPYGFENTYAIAMKESEARRLGVLTISDLRVHAPDLKAGFSVEFLDRAEDGYPSLAAFYDLELGEVKGLEHGLAYEAVDSGAIDLMDVYSTDGQLERYRLRVLIDDRGFFPPYDAAPVVRRELLREHPDLEEVLGRLAYRIPNERMIELNHAVEVDGRGFREVAAEFLTEEGLLDGSAELLPDGSGGRDASFPVFFLGRWRETAARTVEHLRLTLTAVLLATLLAVPLGIAITRSRLAERLSLGAAGVLQTVPSLALLAFLIAVPGLGLHVRSAILALTLYAILPILRNTFAGLRGVEPDLIDAARGMGLTERQILLRIQLPLATRTIMAGIRTATVITVGFATLAAFIGAGGLGQPILTGLTLNDMHLVLAGALPAALLALLAEGGLGWLERRLTPRGLRVREGDGAEVG